jgi:catechol 1,2-dioxygenase
MLTRVRLVDEITYKKASEAADVATQSAILGPFFRTDHPIREKGASISTNTPDDAELVYMHGHVLDAVTKKPIKGATIDVWEASTNGLYEQQDENQVDQNLRGKFVTEEDGSYAFYCIRPTPYPIPYDGPAGKLLQLLDRHPYRPAHIHLIVSKRRTYRVLGADNAEVLAEGYKPITTQIFDKESKYLDDDSVFAVKDSLVVEFTALSGNDQAKKELKYDVHIAPQDSKGGVGTPLVSGGEPSG